jgi:ornithine cyclodeaminase/alanine dehydrogenase-like protein (mu-crystallin family)
MRFVAADEVHRLCAWNSLVDALASAHRGPEPLVGRFELHQTNDGVRDTYFNLPAWQPGIAMGTKIVTVFPANPDQGSLPAVQAVYALFSGKDGLPLALIDGTALTYRKTAADSALGSSLLSRPDSQTLLMVGAGALAPYLVAAHRAVRPGLTKLLVWNRRHDKAATLARDLGGEAVQDLETAARAADIISTATASTEPLILGRWLKPGTHLDLVGGFTPDMRECDDEAVKRASIFVDSRWFAIDDPGDLADPIRRGVIAREAVRADLFQLCKGAMTGRANARETTLFKNGGGAHLDLFTALHIWTQLQ